MLRNKKEHIDKLKEKTNQKIESTKKNLQKAKDFGQRMFEVHDDDVEYINTYYAYANERPTRNVNIVFVMIVGFFILTFLWTAFANIDELARGAGKVIPSSKIQTIQSLDGGIVSEILVKDGDFVKVGDTLMRIDTTRFKASLEESKQEYLSLVAVKTRLQAELDLNPNKEIPVLVFPKEVEENNSNYATLQNNIYKSRVGELKTSLRVLEIQYKQKVQELREIEGTEKQLTRSLELIGQQRITIKKLAKSGIKSNYDVLNIEKEYSQASGDLEAARLSIPRSKLAIAEAENKIIEKVQNFKSLASEDLQKTSAQIKKLESQLVSDEDKVAKTEVVSPVNGIIKQINKNTIGGVVRSGEDLIEIVPDSNILLVEAKIDPRDIAFINPSQKAIVKITAYDFSIYGGLEGKITEISADSIIDKESKEGKSYYRVVIKTNKNYLERHGVKLPIIPGMVASVDIVTGKKTILDFILKPILKVKQNSLHER
ncbi:MAG: HlyD family type I secretion periplasmic adaptor subunit [Candidatus Marinarcus sp.]|uniref:HlyD family type I secretion periplasmic adaptor subunit n=1 Tax=Candidatus Marinarcus sp. TaxID=3100987 RepID=UPI003B001697